MSKAQLTYKMIIIGDSNVGKTSLFKKITSEKFENNIISTIGIDKRTLYITINTQEGVKDVEIQLFDTAGEEKFRSISISYFRGSNGLLVMYDITKSDTFQNLSDWLENINSSLGNNDDYLAILLGNKLDLVEEDKNKREVEEQDAQEFCQINKMFWGGECSVKDINIDKLKNMFKSFIEENNIKLNETESGVLSYYIKNHEVSQNQARVLMILLSKLQNTDFTPTHH